LLTAESVKSPSSEWTPTRKEELAYNATGQPILSIISEGNGTLTERLRTERVYDSADRLVLETQTGWIQRWPVLYSNFIKRLKVIRSFDADGEIGKEIWFRWDEYSESFVIDRKDNYFYHSISTGYPDTAIDPIWIYPNPSSGILNVSGLIRSAEVKIYSIQGTLLKSMQNVEFSFDISDLSSGAYLIQIVEAGHPPVRTVLIKE
jgi:hypothetical protein